MGGKHMKPIRILIGLVVINISVIVGVVQSAKPTIPDNFTLQQVSVQRPNIDAPEVIAGKPSRIVIENVGVDLLIADGEYNITTKEWTLSDTNAHYSLITAPANNSVGNTFIYGHSTDKVFEPIKSLKNGETAVVYTENGKKFTYTLRYIREVSPTDVSLFSYQGPSILTLQTCSGNWYEKRVLYTFDFKEVSSI